MSSQVITFIGRRQPTTFKTVDSQTSQETTILTFDCTRVETHGLDNDVTDHPVEEGVNISDHSRPKPERLTLELIVSDYPISTDTMTQAQALGIAPSGASSTTPSSIPGYAQAVYRKLQDLHDHPALLKVVTLARVYDSMAIETISSPVDASMISAMRFSVTLKRVRVVKNKLTRVVVAKDARAQSKISKGNQTATTPDVPKSHLAAMLDSGNTDTGVKKYVAKTTALFTGTTEN